MLYLVPTPIGNLGDITLRAIEALKAADVIACEDTRHSLRLLNHIDVRKPLVSYHEHNEARRTAELIERLREGANVAVITDAGMPGISDPGHRLLRACIAEGIAYTVLPGPSAVLHGARGVGVPGGELLLWRLPAGEKRPARARAHSRGGPRGDIGFFRVAAPLADGRSRRARGFAPSASSAWPGS